MSDKSVLNKAKTIGSVLGRDSVDFFPELAKLDKSNLIGKTFVIEAARVVDWDSGEGPGQFVLAKIVTVDGEFTTLLGGKVVLKQVKKLMNLKSFPVACQLERKAGQYGEYYQLVSPESI